MVARADLYWAAEPDGEGLVRDICKRRDDFWRFLERSNIVDGTYQLWKFYHGYFWGEKHGRITYGGLERDISQFGVNEFRSRLNLLLTYAVSSDPDWDAQATDSTQRALDATKKANDLLDWGMDSPRYRMGEARRTMAEHALIYRVGYTACLWDPTQGEEKGGDLETLEFSYEGDAKVWNPTLFDVVFDPCVKYAHERKWVLLRLRESKFDLAEVHYAKRDDILSVASSREDRSRFRGMERGLMLSDWQEDQIDKWIFIHLPTPALRSGRMICFVGDQHVLYDGPCPKFYKRLPLVRLVYRETLGTSVVGHSPAIDLAPLQEALNIQASTILSNHRKFGQTKLWKRKSDGDVTIEDLEPGTTFLETETEIKALDLLRSSPELAQFADWIRSAMDSVAGISSVSRGIQEKDTSGIHAALLDAKTIQAQSEFDRNLQQATRDLGQIFLEIWQGNAIEPRQLPVFGENDRMRMESFTSEEIKEVETILVKQGNASLRLASGRLQLAQMLLAVPGLISNQKEVLSILEGAPLDRLTSPEEKQIQLINEENAALKRGEPVVGSVTDDHIGHLKGLVSDVLGSVEARFNPVVVKNATAHVLWHLERLSRDPISQSLMVALGWATPDQIMAMQQIMPPLLAPPGAPGEDGEQPGEEPGGEIIPIQRDEGSPGAVMEGARAHLESEADRANQQQEQAIGV